MKGWGADTIEPTEAQPDRSQTTSPGEERLLAMLANIELEEC